MNIWDKCKLILISQILFNGRNLTFCESHGLKGYTGLGASYRPDHRHEGGLEDIHRSSISRGTHYGSRRPYDTLESPTGRPDYGTVRSKDTVYYKSLDKQGYHTSQQTSIAHDSLIDIDITNKRSTNKVKYYWDEEKETEVYSARDPYLIARVLKGDKVIWKAKGGNYPVLVSASVNEKGRPRLTVLYPSEEDHHLKSYRKSTSGPVVTGREHRPAHRVYHRSRPVRHDQHYDLGYDRGSDLVILDIRTSGDTEEFKYYHDIEKNMIVFTANPHHLFHSIVKGEKVLWTAKDHRYPVKVTVGVNKRGKPSLTIFYPTDEDLTPEGHRTYSTGRQPITRRTHRPDTPYTDRKLSLRRDQDLEPIILDIDLRHADEYKYRRSLRESLDFFTANYPFAFHSIVKGDRVLWRAKAGLYPVKVTVGINERGKPRLTVFYPDETYRPPTPLPRVKRPPTVPTPPVPAKVKPSVKTVELDIERDRVTTKSYYYIKDDSADTANYNCKVGYGFTRVKLRDTQIWKASYSLQHAINVVVEGVGKPTKTVAIHFPNGTKKVFSKAGKNQPWTEVKKGPKPLHPKYYPREVALTFHGSAKENDTDNYKVYKKEGEDVFTYNFNYGLNCTSITIKGATVWKYMDFIYPDSFKYNRGDNTLTLWFNLGFIKYKLTPTGSWTVATSNRVLGPMYHPKEIKVLTKDSNGTIRENDTSKYGVYKEDESDKFTYTFTAGAKCTKIIHHGKSLWKSGGTNEHSADCYPRSFIYSKTDNTFTLNFNSGKIFFSLNNDLQWVITTSTLPLQPNYHPGEVKVTIEDSNGNARENDTSKYEVYVRDRVFTYTFSPDSKCSKITHAGMEVWKHSTNNPHIDAFSYIKSGNTFILYFGLEYVNCALDTTTGSWKAGNMDSIIKLTTRDSYGRIRENDTYNYHLTNPDPYTFNFMLKDGSKCTMVTHLGKQVWKYDSTDDTHPKSIVYNNKYNKFTLTFESGSTTYSLDTITGKWKIAASTLPLEQRYHPPKIKVTTKGSSIVNDITKYSVYKKEGTEVFTYTFKHNAQCNQITYDDKVVWTRDSDEVLDSFTYNKKSNEFTLRFGQEYVKYTIDSATGSSIMESSTFPLQRYHHPPNVNVTTKDSSTVNDTSKYKVTKLLPDNYMYKFNPSVKCTKITCDDKEVWKCDSYYDPVPYSFTYNKSDNTFKLTFDCGSTLYSLDSTSGKWVVRTSTIPLKPKELPGEVKVTTEGTRPTSYLNTRDCTVIKTGDNFHYTFQNDAKCTSITHEGKDVWNKDTRSSITGTINDVNLGSFTYNKKNNTFTLYFGLDCLNYRMNSITGQWEELKKQRQ